MRFKYFLSACLISLFCIFFQASGTEVYAAEQPDGKAYLLVIDKLQLEDIDAGITPALASILKNGSIGLASNRTVRGHNSMDTSLTIGAGNLARAYTNEIMAYNADEIVAERGIEARQLYQGLTGFQTEGYASFLVNIAEINTSLQKEHVTTVPGAMGELLAQNGRKVCVLGNGDLYHDANRNALAIAMDQKGRVPLGDIGPDTTEISPAGFLSRETDYEYLKKAFLQYKEESDLLVVDLSDLDRLEEADTALPEMQAVATQQRLMEIDAYVRFVQQQMDADKDQLWIIAPSPNKLQLANKNLFTPVIIYGKGVEAGYLSSAATRRPYIIANTDIAPGIASFFGISDFGVNMIGRPPASYLSVENTLEQAKAISDSASRVNRLRSPIIKTYVVIQIIIILLVLLSIFVAHKRLRLFESFILALVVVPLVLLPLGQLRLGNDWSYIAMAVVMTVLITVLLQKIFKGNGFRGFIAMAALTTIAINIDLLTGGSLIKSSVLGYDPMVGARYYGIGNEYMGVLIGCSIAIAAAAYEKLSRRWVLGMLGLFFLLECYIIAGPSIGANSDGFITAPVAFLITLFLLGNVKIRPSVLLGIGTIVLLLIGGITYFDLQKSAELQSHIGRAASSILSGGWQEGFTIVSRKVAMNIKLIKYTIWSRVFLVILLVLSVLLYRPLGAMKALILEHPYIVKGFEGILVGAVVGLLVNDSGIVVASTTSIYLVVPFLLLMLKQQTKLKAD